MLYQTILTAILATVTTVSAAPAPAPLEPRGAYPLRCNGHDMSLYDMSVVVAYIGGLNPNIIINCSPRLELAKDCSSGVPSKCAYVTIIALDSKTALVSKPKDVTRAINNIMKACWGGGGSTLAPNSSENMVVHVNPDWV